MCGVKDNYSTRGLFSLCDTTVVEWIGVGAPCYKGC